MIRENPLKVEFTNRNRIEVQTSVEKLNNFQTNFFDICEKFRLDHGVHIANVLTIEFTNHYNGGQDRTVVLHYQNNALGNMAFFLIVSRLNHLIPVPLPKPRG